MKHLNLLLLVVILTCTTAFASQKRKVLFIGIDGTRSDALQAANTPNLDSLVAHGSYTYDSWCLGITVSGPTWSTIFTGVWYPKHGVTDNSYSGAQFDKYHLYPALAKQYKPSLYASEVMEWPPLIDDVPNIYDGYDVRIHVTDGGTTPTASATATQLLNANVDVMTCYFDLVDITGHSSGFSPSNPAYINAIQSVDAAIGTIITALKNRPTYSQEDWLILVETDHGGTGTGHGGNTASERHIWWIGAGPNIRHRQLNSGAIDPGSYRVVPPGVDTVALKSVPVQADIAVTALHFLLYDLNIYPSIRALDSLDGVSWLDTIYVPPVTGITPTYTLNEELKMYPNPTSNIVTFWFDHNNAPVSYTVVNQSGAVVRKEDVTSMQGLKLNIDLSQQPNGTYIIRLQVGNEVAERKVQIQH